MGIIISVVVYKVWGQEFEFKCEGVNTFLFEHMCAHIPLPSIDKSTEWHMFIIPRSNKNCVVDLGLFSKHGIVSVLIIGKVVWTKISSNKNIFENRTLLHLDSSSQFHACQNAYAITLSMHDSLWA